MAVAATTPRAQRTRAALAQATHDVIADRGHLEVQAIAEAADCSPATFYSHFSTHDDALAAALDLTLERVVAVARRHFHVEAMLDRGLEGVVKRLLEELHGVFLDESAVLTLALARLPHHRGVRAVYRAHERESLEHLTRQVELGRKARLLGGGDPGERATAVLVLAQSLNNPLLRRPGTTDGVLEHLRNALLATLRPQP